jgi:hypothetical protein
VENLPMWRPASLCIRSVHGAAGGTGGAIGWGKTSFQQCRWPSSMATVARDRRPSNSASSGRRCAPPLMLSRRRREQDSLDLDYDTGYGHRIKPRVQAEFLKHIKDKGGDGSATVTEFATHD